MANRLSGSAASQIAAKNECGSSSAMDIIKYRAENFLQQSGSPAPIEAITSAGVIEDNKLSDDKLVELVENVSNDNFFPTFPTDPKELAQLAAVLQNNLDNAKIVLDNAPLSADTYQKQKVAHQNKAAYLLLLECHIGARLKDIEHKRGLKKDSKQREEDGSRSKAQIIEQDFRLSSRQARDFQRLTWDGVKTAIEIAFKSNESPTRALALAKSTQKQVLNNSSGVVNSIQQSIARKKLKDLSFELNDKTLDEHKTLSLKEPMFFTSLFANIGVGIHYLKEINLHCAVANEKEKDRADYHKHLHPDCAMVQGNIKDKEVFDELVRLHKAKGCKIVLASPPCQISSGLNTSKNKGNDIRATLFDDIEKFVRAVDSDYVLIENVPGWLTDMPEVAKPILGENTTIGEYMVAHLEDMGYKVNVGVYNAADYGTAESRERCLILASKTGKWEFPKKEEYQKILLDAIGHLPSLKPGEVSSTHRLHYSRKLEDCVLRFVEQTPTGCSAWDNNAFYQPVNADGSSAKAQFQASYSRLDWGKPGATIVTGSGQIGSPRTIHPGRPLTNGTYSDSRPLSIHELLLVVGLPADFPIPFEVQEDGMLKNADETFVREVIGEHFCPLHVKALMSTLPIPVDDVETLAEETPEDSDLPF